MAENESESDCGCKGKQSQSIQPKGDKGRTPSSTIIRDSEPDSK